MIPLPARQGCIYRLVLIAGTTGPRLGSGIRRYGHWPGIADERNSRFWQASKEGSPFDLPAFNNGMDVGRAPMISQPVDWEAFLAGIAGGKTGIGYSRNRNIFCQGQPADAVFYMRRGKVKLSATSRPCKFLRCYEFAVEEISAISRSRNGQCRSTV